jgi:glutamate-1-semialdehyde 2,1-aminomutase
MQERNYSKSEAVAARARKVVPGASYGGVRFSPSGMYGHYAMNYVAPGYPRYFSRASGSKFWDIDGNEFIDYMCAYGPMVLGYSNPAVDNAVINSLKEGNTVSLASPLMVDLAEKLLSTVTPFAWAAFSKNGGDATNQACMVARHATGRRKIVVVNGGYHGTVQWMQDPGSPGTLDTDSADVLRVGWNDYAGFEKLASEYRGEIAAFFSSPYHHPLLVDNEMPAPGYWGQVEKLCRREGIVLVLDDVRAGFRASLHGSHHYFGFTPDLICLGKALGSGQPIAALLGTDALRDAVSDVFVTGTQYYNTAPIAAAIATLQELESSSGPERMLAIGMKLCRGLVEIATKHGFDLRATGLPSMPYLRLADEIDPVVTQGLSAFHTGLYARLIRSVVEQGAYFSDFHNNFVSTAHTDEDLERTWEMVDTAFARLAREMT